MTDTLLTIPGVVEYVCTIVPVGDAANVHINAPLEPIVRCRECKHATISTIGVCKYCEMFVRPDVDGYGADPQVNLPLDFFCAWGERRDA